MKLISCKYSYILLLLLLLSSCAQTNKKSGFALVIDKASYAAAKSEVTDYAETIKKQGLHPIIVVDSTADASAIRKRLKKLYIDEEMPIEGAVFIGDIPVPMIRDAQHFTRAFKMNQDKYSWDRSSVPSDRFYDDFDLEFEFLKKDSLNPNHQYYALKETSTQYLQPEIYSGRIKPFAGENKYEDIKNYLRKVVRVKQVENELDEVLFFAGHGYNSESMTARMDEKIALYEHLPWLKTQSNRLEYIDFTFDDHIRHRLMSELQRNDLDMALLHHHGDDDVQYLSGLPETKGITQQVAGVKLFLRSKLRAAKRRGRDLKETKKGYMERHGVPSSWFDGAFEEAQIKKDSILYAKMDITLKDMEAYVPKAEFVMFDSCFNGAFQKDAYLSAAYIFGPGNTVVAFANSVSSLQDKWPNELIGLLGLGMSVGNWSKHVAYLETHIIGDPTFKFHQKENKEDLNSALRQKASDIPFWRGKLNAKFPDMQALALRKLYENNYSELSDHLLHTFKNNPHGVVRMEALKLLTTFNDSNFKTALRLGLSDSYEFVRRQSIYLIGKCGDADLVPDLVAAAMVNNTSRRENFNLKYALQTFTKEEVAKHTDSVFTHSTHYRFSDSLKNLLSTRIEKQAGGFADIALKLKDTSLSAKKKHFAIRTLRNYNYHSDVPSFIDFVKSSDNTNLQVYMLEALSWFNLSYQKQAIIQFCDAVMASDRYTDVVRKEALRTKNRLEVPWYR